MISRFFFFSIILLFNFTAHAADTITLEGEWRLKLDQKNVGIEQQWYKQNLPDRIKLPGTTDQATKGHQLRQDTMDYDVPIVDSDWPGHPTPQRIDESGHLLREWLYIGKAWYQRDIDIPASWSSKHIRLCLERVIWGTKVWLDDRYIGSFDSLVTEHQFDLGELTTGTHRLTICVDNDLQCNIGIIGHAYGPETQSRWNGIVGDIELIATDPLFIHSLQVYPAPDCKSVMVKAKLRNLTTQSAQANLAFVVQSEYANKRFGLATASLRIEPGMQTVEKIILIDHPVQQWDEFNHTRYQLTVDLKTNNLHDAKTDIFGFRHLERDGRHLRLNNRRLFLRGTLDCCVYPKTGHPPMSLDEWLRVLGTIKEYGFNHVRFHSWCPPEAAFEAADRLGLYLAPETPIWVDNWTRNTSSKPKLIGQDPNVLEYVRHEIQRISDAYGNHPSFTFFCLGNEFGMSSDWKLIDNLLAQAKQYDSRRLYNATTARNRIPHDNFWVTHQVPKPQGGSAPSRGVGPSHTNWDFHQAVQSTDLPIIAHETGQRPVFPDYDDLLPKFTGPLKPYNYERLRNQLATTGLLNQVKDFERASARFQYLQYKAEHEAILRTPDYAGYQLLMLNDFTGQSEALVGILDPFWQSKGIITAAQVRQWNAPTVLLARFDSYTWITDQTFTAQVEAAHFGPGDLKESSLQWTLTTSSGEVLAKGFLDPLTLPTGGITRLGRIKAPLHSLTKATAMTLRFEMDKTVNQWTLWAYPPAADDPAPKDIIITKIFDDVLQALSDGRRVLFLAHSTKSAYASRTGFHSVYWSAGWWGNKFSSLGILCDTLHPALVDFPHDGHSDFQWHELTHNATTFLLTDTPADFRPIVQPVTDFHHNQLLGQVFEARLGSGCLLVCAFDIASNLQQRPAARQFRRSLLRYMQTDAFQPQHELKVDYLKRIFGY